MPGRGVRVLVATAALLVIAALLLFLSITRSIRPSSALRENGFIGPEDAGEAYAAAGNGLAVAGNGFIRLYAASGKCVAEQAVEFADPMCVGSSLLGAYYDLNAPDLLALYPDGSCRRAQTGAGVAFADVNETGLVTVILTDDDSRGFVMVYDTDLTPLFRWEPGGGYVICARTRGEDTLCVNCLTPEGAVLRFFRIDSDQEQGRLSLPGELVVDMDFLSDGTLAAVTENWLLLVDGSGELISSMDFGESRLEAWSLDGGFAAVATVSAQDGGSGTITSLSSDGQILGSCPASRHVEALSGGKDALLVYYTGDESTLYGADLTELVNFQPDEDVTRVFLTPNDMAFYAGSGGVTLVDFGQ